MILKELPEDFKKEIDVVACYIEHDDNILLLKRQDSKTHGGKFGLPAGKIEEGESTADAMVREIYEETGLEIDKANLNFIDTLFVRDDGHDFIYTSFRTKINEDVMVHINNNEHKEYIWVTPGEALGMDLVYGLDECLQLHYNLRKTLQS